MLGVDLTFLCYSKGFMSIEKGPPMSNEQKNETNSQLNGIKQTRMTIFIKTKFNKSDDQMNIDNIKLRLILNSIR